MGLQERYIQLAGSAKETVDPAVLAKSHDFVRALIPRILAAGGRLIVGIGEDLRRNPSDPNSALLFDWTVLDEIERFCKQLEAIGQKPPTPCALVISSQKNLGKIPENRRTQWEYLVDGKAISVRTLAVNWNAAAYIRQQQAQFGHGLVIFGGGEGVEHLASLYVAAGHVVVPLDPDLGAIRNDGIGGAKRLFHHALANPDRFVLSDERDFADGLRLTSLANVSDPGVVADRVVRLLDRFSIPYAFCIRLLNPKSDKFTLVQNFFDNTIRPSLSDLNFHNVEIGRNASTDAFINQEIFERLHYAEVAVADLTELRPNNFFEAGYALGRPIPVIFTAMDGTQPPFDTQAVPIFFWKDEPDLVRRPKFMEHWRRYIQRPPLVRHRELG